jgi:hypothetical protein
MSQCRCDQWSGKCAFCQEQGIVNSAQRDPNYQRNAPSSCTCDQWSDGKCSFCTNQQIVDTAKKQSGIR